MDFVVVGLGLGALGLLVGVLLTGWSAGRWRRAAARASVPEDARYADAMSAARRDIGHVLLAAGGAMMLATIGALAGSLDDRTGALLISTTATVAALGLLIWGYLYRARNPRPARPRSHQTALSTAGAAPARPARVPEIFAGNPAPLSATEHPAPVSPEAGAAPAEVAAAPPIPPATAIADPRPESAPEAVGQVAFAPSPEPELEPEPKPELGSDPDSDPETKIGAEPMAAPLEAAIMNQETAAGDGDGDPSSSDAEQDQPQQFKLIEIVPLAARAAGPPPPPPGDRDDA